MEKASLKNDDNSGLIMEHTHLKEGEDYKVDEVDGDNVYDLEMEL